MGEQRSELIYHYRNIGRALEKKSRYWRTADNSVQMEREERRPRSSIRQPDDNHEAAYLTGCRLQWHLTARGLSRCCFQHSRSRQVWVKIRHQSTCKRHVNPRVVFGIDSWKYQTHITYVNLRARDTTELELHTSAKITGANR